MGDNGHGKTNFLEAIAYLELLRSMRGVRDRDLIRFGATAFHIASEAAGTAVHRTGIGVERTGKKRITLDGVETPRLTDALGAVPSVCFSPSDISFVAGAPAERRRYMDIALALSSKRYLAALRHYRAALARRNAALREAARLVREAFERGGMGTGAGRARRGSHRGAACVGGGGIGGVHAPLRRNR